MQTRVSSAILLLVAMVSQLLLGSQSSMLGTSGGDTASALAGKSILFIGDSLTTGCKLSDPEDAWTEMLGSQYGMEVTVGSVNGSTIAAADYMKRTPGGCKSPMCTREIPREDFDIVFLEGSGNDWFCEIPLGDDPESRDPYTELGAINVLIDRVQEACPSALVVFMTSWNSTGELNGLGLTTQEYNNCIAEVCALRGIPCFTACDPEISGIDASTEESRKQYFVSATDHWHLNADAHKQYLPVIAGWLQAVLCADYTCCGFYDVTRGDWFSEDVEYVYANCLMNGTSGTTFSPDDPMLRADLAAVLYRMAGSPNISHYAEFDDMDDVGDYRMAISWVVNNGISNGTSESTFSPGEAVTRSQLALMLYRFADSRNLPRENTADLSAYTDITDCSDELLEALSWAVGSGLLKGTEETLMDPDAPLTRAEAAVVLHRFHAAYGADL